MDQTFQQSYATHGGTVSLAGRMDMRRVNHARVNLAGGDEDRRTGQQDVVVVAPFHN